MMSRDPSYVFSEKTTVASTQTKTLRPTTAISRKTMREFNLKPKDLGSNYKENTTNFIERNKVIIMSDIGEQSEKSFSIKTQEKQEN